MTACRCGCGRPVHANGLASACNRRRAAAGLPAGAMPPPPQKRGGMTVAGHAAAEARRDAEYADYLDWLERRNDQRVTRWLQLLTAGARSVQARDRHGVQVLWERTVRAGDFEAFFTAALAYIAELQGALEGERTTSEEGEAA